MTVFFVVPCGGAKVAHEARAEDLYVGSAFRMALAAAKAEAAATVRDLGEDARVLIMSAKHGLVELSDVLAPYDVKMGDAGSVDAHRVAAQAFAKGMNYDDQVYAMLPKAYRRVLAAALALHDDMVVQDVYEAAPGIGYQRGVAASVSRSAALVMA